MQTPIPTNVPSDSVESRRFAAGVLMGLFFAIGFLTCLNDIVLTHLKLVFALNFKQAALVQFFFFAAYFVMSPPSGMLIRRWGYKRAIVVGLGAAGVGCLGFFPAAAFRLYPLFLGSLFVVASGFTLLQVAANPYVAILGPKETASSRLTLTQAFNSVGTTIAPFIGAWLILPSTAPGAVVTDAARDAAAKSVQLPYVAFAAVLVVMSVSLSLMKLPEVRPEKEAVGSSSIWAHPPLVYGVVALFLYVGAEVAIGSFIFSFLQSPTVGGFDAQTAGRGISIYWGGAMIGRFVGAGALRKWTPRYVLAAAAAIALLLVGATVLLPGSAAMVTILAVGLFNSIMFPTIFTLAIDGLGDRTGQGSGVLCMAIVGGAILPFVQGAVVDHAGVHLGFLVPMVSYAYIAWYGLAGSVKRPAGIAASSVRAKEASLPGVTHS